MERVMRGAISGAVAGVAQNVWNLGDYYLVHNTTIRFLDWAAVLLSWSKPENWYQSVFYQVFQVFVWNALLGVFFAYLILLISSRSIILKGVAYALVLWFNFKVAVNFVRAPVLSGSQPFPGAMSNLVAVVIWGIVLGFVFGKLERRTSER